MFARTGGARAALFAGAMLTLVLSPVTIESGHRAPGFREAVAFADDDGDGGRPIGSGDLERARLRYGRVIAKSQGGQPGRMFGRALGAVAVRLDDAATRAMIEGGWKMLPDSPIGDLPPGQEASAKAAPGR